MDVTLYPGEEGIYTDSYYFVQFMKYFLVYNLIHAIVLNII